MYVCVYVCMVQLKGNLTHADRAHTTYWPKAHGYINPYWRVQEEKPANIIFKRQEYRLRGHYSVSSHGEKGHGKIYSEFIM